MSLSGYTRRFSKLVTDNSPTILTAIGVTGTVTTAYLASKASVKAYQVIEAEEAYNGSAEDPKERLKDRAKLTWKLYVPTAVSGTLTVVAIVGANRIGNRRTAALAAAYTLSERALVEYKDKVVETIGEKKAERIRDEIAQDHVNRDPVTDRNLVVIAGKDVIFRDDYSGRYFTSDMETVKKAINDVNYMVLNHYYASLSDFYDKIGLSHTKLSDDVGWNSDALMEVTFSTSVTDDDRPCFVLDFAVAPTRGFSRVH